MAKRSRFFISHECGSIHIRVCLAVFLELVWMGKDFSVRAALLSAACCSSLTFREITCEQTGPSEARSKRKAPCLWSSQELLASWQSPRGLWLLRPGWLSSQVWGLKED